METTSRENILFVFTMKVIYCFFSNEEPILEIHNRAVPTVEAHHCVNSPDTGRNSGGRQMKKNLKSNFFYTFGR